MAPSEESENRVPKLKNTSNFKIGTMRLKHPLNLINIDLWKSTKKGPFIPEQPTAPDRCVVYAKESIKSGEIVHQMLIHLIGNKLSHF